MRSYIPLLVVLATAGPLRAGAGWWHFTWSHRRPVHVGQVVPTHLDGDDIAVVTMPTGGLTKPDASDVRVVTGDGRDMCLRVLMTGPGDRVTVAFAVVPGVSRYYVYFGHPNPPPAKPLDIRRGVLLETWEYPGGPIKNLKQTRAVFSKTSRLLGRDFVDRVFLGLNPFGPQNRIASVFTAYLDCPADGQYTFSSSSRNASFLLLDGKLVVNNGGQHRPQRNVRKRGKVKLKEGLHKLTFYHVSPGGDPVAVAAWRPPGGPRIEPIPAKAFAPVTRARPGPMERYGKRLTIDFLPVHAGETFVIDRYYQRYKFKALSSAGAGKSARWKWDFGDGQSFAEPEIEHVYLLDGQYTVTLTGRTFAGVLKRSNRIVVARPWARTNENRLDKFTWSADIVAEYDFAALETGANAQAVLLLQRAGKFEALLAAGEAFVSRDKAPGDAVLKIVPIYAEVLISHKLAGRAAKAFLQAAKMTEVPAVRAKMIERAGRVYLDELGDGKAALGAFERVIQRYKDSKVPRVIRDARIGVGDVRRSAGDYAKAVQAYASAGTRPRDPGKKAPFLKGDFARHVEDYLRVKQYRDAEDYLDRWEDAFPTEKLAGYSTSLRVKLLAAQKRFAKAAAEAEVLVRVNPASNYAPQILLLAAEAYTSFGKPDKAVETYRRIVTDYPESPLAAEAAKKLR